MSGRRSSSPATRSTRRCGGACSSSCCVLTVGVPRPLLARRAARRSRRSAGSTSGRPGVDAETLAGRDAARARDVRDALPRRRARRLPHARRRARRRRARPAAAARRPAARPRRLPRGPLPRRRGASAPPTSFAVYAAGRADHAARRAAGGRTASSCPGSSSPPRCAIVAALSLLGSVFLSATANGIAVFMVYGAGLVAGPARPDRRGDGLGDAASRSRARPRGRSRSRRSTRTRCTGSRPTPAGSPSSRSSSARSAARSREAGLPLWAARLPRRLAGAAASRSARAATSSEGQVTAVRDLLTRAVTARCARSRRRSPGIAADALLDLARAGVRLGERRVGSSAERQEGDEALVGAQEAQRARREPVSSRTIRVDRRSSRTAQGARPRRRPPRRAARGASARRRPRAPPRAIARSTASATACASSSDSSPGSFRWSETARRGADLRGR